MAGRTLFCVVVFVCLSASLELANCSVIEKLKEAITQTKESYNETIKENERLEQELSNLTDTFGYTIQDMRNEESNMSQEIKGLIDKLQNASTDILKLEFELEFMRKYFGRLTTEDKKLALAIRTTTRELESYRLDNASGDFMMCHQYHKGAAKVGHLLVAPLGYFSMEKQILEAKLAQAKEALWAAQYETEQIQKKTLYRKARLATEVKRLQELITRDGLNKKKLEDDIKSANADIEELAREIAQVAADIVVWTVEVSKKRNTITNLKLEYDGYRNDSDCFLWLREWAFNDVPPEE